MARKAAAPSARVAVIEAVAAIGARVAQPIGAARATANPRRVAHWMLSGGNARTVVQADYAPGAETLAPANHRTEPAGHPLPPSQGRRRRHPLDPTLRQFAIGLVALGLSGLVMWSRGRTARQMIFSIAGAALLVTGLIAASAIL